MASVVTAQVVKAGEIVALMLPPGYVAGCVFSSLAVGGFTFCAPSRTVERANTVLTVALLVGFGFVVGSALVTATSASLGAAAQRLAGFADWSQLSPLAAGPRWAVPIFLNLLCYGQAIPFVVERMAPRRGNAAAGAAGAAALAAEADEARRRTRTAIVLGSAVPLLLCVLWSAITASGLFSSAASWAELDDPVLELMRNGAPSVAYPVSIMAVGAIGTTLIASYLTIQQFTADFFCTIFGRCSPLTARLCALGTVAFPVALASGGPALYLPLLAFAGAGPTTLLYGLIPPLTVYFLRRERDECDGGSRAREWLPLGSPMLCLLGVLASSILLSAVAGTLSSAF